MDTLVVEILGVFIIAGSIASVVTLLYVMDMWHGVKELIIRTKRSGNGS